MSAPENPSGIVPYSGSGGPPPTPTPVQTPRPGDLPSSPATPHPTAQFRKIATPKPDPDAYRKEIELQYRQIESGRTFRNGVYRLDFRKIGPEIEQQAVEKRVLKELVEISLDSGVANKVLRTEEQMVRIRPNRRVRRAILSILDDQKKFANPPMKFKMGFKEDTVILRGEVFFYD